MLNERYIFIKRLKALLAVFLSLALIVAVTMPGAPRIALADDRTSAAALASDVIDLSACTVTCAQPAATYTYNGAEQQPSVVVADASGTIVDASQYTVSYSNNINAGTANVTVNGISGVSTGACSTTFTIAQLPIEVAWEGSSFIYDGAEHETTATVTNKVEGDYLELNVVNNIDSAVGNYLAEVYGIYGNSNYTMAGASGTTHEWLISYLETDDDATVSGDTYNDSGWLIGDAKLVAPAGFSVSADGQTWAATLPVTAEGESAVTYQLREDATGDITDVRTKNVKLDTINPLINGVEVAAKTTSATVTIDFTEGTSGLSEFETLLMPEGATYTFAGNVLMIEGLEVETDYDFIVMAVDASGRSASYEVKLTTSAKSDSDDDTTPSHKSNSSSSKTSSSATTATGDSALVLFAGIGIAALAALAAMLFARRRKG